MSSQTAIQQIEKTACFAWSPATLTTGAPMLATGTLAGAMDATFSTSAQLEVHRLNGSDSKPTAIASLTTPTRFNRLVWGSHGGNSGVLIGGFEDGGISFWNVERLLAQGISNGDNADSNASDSMSHGDSSAQFDFNTIGMQQQQQQSNQQDSLIAHCEAHQGAVRGLQVNPFQPYLVASGATEGEVWVWDQNNLEKPYAPSHSKSAKLADITDLGWNASVPHIFATSSNSGVCVVWDLKSRREVLQLSAPGTAKTPFSALAWSPENATQILVASEDDAMPVIYSWDLRNARAPLLTLKGHEKGILSLAWCPKDAGLLLSCGKDGQTICWNPSDGQVLNRIPTSPPDSTWQFDVQWSPRNPDLFCTASLSGLLSVESYQAVSAASNSSNPAHISSSQFFNQNPLAQQQQSLPSASSHATAPKWLKCPIGVSWGFGGKLVSWGFGQSASKASTSGAGKQRQAVMIHSMESLDLSINQWLNDAIALNHSLCAASESLSAYCQEKATNVYPLSQPGLQTQPNGAGNSVEAVFWNVVAALSAGFAGAEKEDVCERIFSLLDLPKSMQDFSLSTLSLSQAFSCAATSASLGEEQNEHENVLADGGDRMGNDLQSPTTTTTATIDAADNVHSLFSAAGGGENDENDALAFEFDAFSIDNDHHSDQNGNNTFSLINSGMSKTDSSIAKAIINGNIEVAVAICIKNGRMADALLLSELNGGGANNPSPSSNMNNSKNGNILGNDPTNALKERVKDFYFAQKKPSYLRLLGAVSRGGLCDLVSNGRCEEWEHILGLLCRHHQKYIPADSESDPKDANGATTSPSLIPATFKTLIRQLAMRLQKEVGVGSVGTLVCSLLAGEAQLAIDCLCALNPTISIANKTDSDKTCSKYAEGLQSFIEQYRIIEWLSSAINKAQSPSIDFPDKQKLFCEYAVLLSQAGKWQIACRYFIIGGDGDGGNNSDDLLASFCGRVCEAGRVVGGIAGAKSIDGVVQVNAPPSAANPNSQMPGANAHAGNSQQAFNRPFAAMNQQAPPAQRGMLTSPTSMSPAMHTAKQAIPRTMHQTPLQSQQTMPSFPNQAQQPQPSFGIPPQFPPQAPSAPTNLPPPPPMQQHQQQNAAPFFNHHQGPPQQHQAPTARLPPPTNVSSSQPRSSSIASSGSSGHNNFGTLSPPPPPFAPGGGGNGAPMDASQTRFSQVPPQPQKSLQPNPTIPAPPTMMQSTSPSNIGSKSMGGGFNDPPIVPARGSVGQSFGSASSVSNMPAAPRSSPPPFANAPPINPSPANTNPASAPRSSPSTPSSPVDPSNIAPEYQAIHRSLSTLILQCQNKAMPMQRRIVEDSARRMNTLFSQLSNSPSTALSPAIIQALQGICQAIDAGNYEQAHQHITPLMTRHFAECSGWVLAAKRLIEVAKICLR